MDKNSREYRSLRMQARHPRSDRGLFKRERKDRPPKRSVQI